MPLSPSATPISVLCADQLKVVDGNFTAVVDRITAVHGSCPSLSYMMPVTGVQQYAAYLNSVHNNPGTFLCLGPQVMPSTTSIAGPAVHATSCASSSISSSKSDSSGRSAVKATRRGVGKKPTNIAATVVGCSSDSQTRNHSKSHVTVHPA